MTTIVAVHGNGGGSTRFDRVRVHLRDGVEFITPDLPGFNGVAVDTGLRSVADYADHLADTIEKSCHGVPPVVLGHGIGGSIALDLASRRPETMSGLILHAPVGADLDRRWFPKLMSTPAMRDVVRRAIAARLLRPAWRRVFFPAGAPADELDRFFEGYRSCASFGQMFDIIDAEWFAGLVPVDQLPTILLWGEHDRVLKSAHTDRIRAKVPHARVVIEAGWDHFPMIEQPEEYARVVADLADGLVATST